MTVKVINDQKQYNEMTLYDITAKDTHQYNLPPKQWKEEVGIFWKMQHACVFSYERKIHILKLLDPGRDCTCMKKNRNKDRFDD